MGLTLIMISHLLMWERNDCSCYCDFLAHPELQLHRMSFTSPNWFTFIEWGHFSRLGNFRLLQNSNYLLTRARYIDLKEEIVSFIILNLCYKVEIIRNWEWIAFKNGVSSSHSHVAWSPASWLTVFDIYSLKSLITKDSFVCCSFNPCGCYILPCVALSTL